MRKAASALAASSRLDDQTVTKFAPHKQHKGLLNSTGHGTLETVERFLVISRLIARRCDTVSALQRGCTSDDSGDASSICRLSSVGAFRGPCISPWIHRQVTQGTARVAFPNYRIVVKRSQPMIKLLTVNISLVVEIVCSKSLSLKLRDDSILAIEKIFYFAIIYISLLITILTRF